jgi:hypothetical protein
VRIVFVLTLRYAYAEEDLEAGGLFAVAFLALVAFAVVEMVPFTAALSVGIAGCSATRGSGSASWPVGSAVC